MFTTPTSACSRVNSSIHWITRWKPFSNWDRLSTKAAGRSTESTPKPAATSSTAATAAGVSSESATSAAMSTEAGTCRRSVVRSTIASPSSREPWV